MPAVAMTDHGNVFGAYEFYKKAKAAGVKPIIGIEAYFTPGISRVRAQGRQLLRRRPDDVSRPRRLHAHDAAQRVHRGDAQPLPAQHRRVAATGSSSSRAWTASCSPEHAKGLIATTGCPSGEVQVHLRLGNYDAARQAAADYQDIFGRDNYFLELMDHGLDHRDAGPRRAAPAGQGPADPAARHQRLPLRHARGRAEPGAPAVHQLRLDDGHPGRRRPGQRFAFNGDGYYLKSAGRDARDLARAARGLRQHAADRRALRRRVHRGQRHLHAALPVSRGRDRGDLARQGGRARAGPPLPRRRHARRCASRAELRDRRASSRWASRATSWWSPTSSTGPSSRASGSGPGRGSGAGSIVAYAMRITDLDPLVHGLLFERFLNPERISMPDFDIDFDERRRGEVIRYVTDKYGEDRVAHDRHLRHHQGQAGGQGLQPDPRLPVRDGRPDHQGDAGRR